MEGPSKKPHVSDRDTVIDGMLGRRVLWGRSAAPAAVALLCLLGLAAPKNVLAAEDPAATLYDPDSIGVIKLELSPAAIQALTVDPEGEYQAGTFSYAETDGTPTGIGSFSEPQPVEVRLKGSGSFRPLGQKAAFKLKFPKKEPFRGLRKMTLNNMVQDRSMVHERLAYEVFASVGVPHSRTGFVDVVLNGQDYGVHLNIESLDKVALEKRFGVFQDPPQHLYEGEYNADVAPSRVGLIEADEGDEADRSDLDALVTVVNGGSGDWSDRVEPHADLPEMTRMWAAEHYMGHVDGYSGQDRENMPNNFYLYSDTAGRFQMLPWGTDQTWVEKQSFTASAGVLFDGCLADTSCNAMYKAANGEVLQKVPALDLDTVARCTAAMLAPWQALEPSGIRQASASQIASAVAATRTWIAQRPAEAAAYVGIPAPVAESPRPCPVGGPEEPGEEPEEEEPEKEPGDGEEPPPGTPGGGQAPAGPTPGTDPPVVGGGSTQAAAASLVDPGPPALQPSEGPLRLTLTTLSGARLQTHVHAPFGGQLKLTARLGERGRGPDVCSLTTDVPEGITAIGCRVEPRTRPMLADSARRVMLGAVLRGAGGSRQEFTRVIRIGGR